MSLFKIGNGVVCKYKDSIHYGELGKVIDCRFRDGHQYYLVKLESTPTLFFYKESDIELSIDEIRDIKIEKILNLNSKV